MRSISIFVAVLLTVVSGQLAIAVGPAFSAPAYIEKIFPQTDLYGPNKCAKLWADVEVPADISIARIWADIYPPGSTEVLTTDLPDRDRGGRYSTIYCNFTDEGSYMVVIHAEDSNGTEAVPDYTSVSRMELTADKYEPDDTFEDAGIVILNNSKPQSHNFHDAGDADWVIFYGLAGKTYTFRVDNLQSLANAVIELYGADGAELLEKSGNDESSAGAVISMDWTCPESGTYPVKISNFNPQYFGQNLTYTFEIFRPTADSSGGIKGYVYNILNGRPIGLAEVYTSNTGSGHSDNKINRDSDSPSATIDTEGRYIINEEPPPVGTTYTLYAEADGYRKYEKGGIIFAEGETIVVNILMVPEGVSVVPGDLNGNEKWDLEDLILSLQTASGIITGVSSQTDVSGDHRIGLEEALFLLRKISHP